MHLSFRTVYQELKLASILLTPRVYRHYWRDLEKEIVLELQDLDLLNRIYRSSNCGVGNFIMLLSMLVDGVKRLNVRDSRRLVCL